ncbi:MAG: TlyA family RNA methyltransferase [Nitrospirae bacterium]|nr:TlyA family RNA methyltransferase [Nitrospirota bacterium]
MTGRERIDKLLVDRGLVKSRERAKALIMEGRVTVRGAENIKAGSLVPPDAEISLKGSDIPFVSRGGIKLDAALDHFEVAVEGRTVMDVGCSTGGFTDCLLKRRARKVYAIDVGYGQFDWALRNDPRVVLLEKTNIRHVDRSLIADAIDLAVMDLSFISLLKVLPKIYELLGDGAGVIALVKPQFEVGKGQVGKGGIVRDEGLRLRALENVIFGAQELGFTPRGHIVSPITGQKGNIEYLIYLGRN